MPTSVTLTSVTLTNVLCSSLAHEVAHIKKKDFLLISSLSPVTLLVSYYTARVLPKALFPRYTTPAVPAVFVVCILIYFHVQSSLGRWLEFRADRVAAQSHPRYREGGIEYMKKNILLQSYLEPMGKNPSTMNPLTSKHPTFQGFVYL
jgi:Zn-dependent protease with chaperone function